MVIVMVQLGITSQVDQQEMLVCIGNHRNKLSPDVWSVLMAEPAGNIVITS